MKTPLLRTSLRILPLQLVAQGTEALMPIVMGACFGRSRATDIYYFAWTFFQLIGSLLFAAYRDSAVIPILAEAKLSGNANYRIVVGSLLTHTTAAGAALALVSGAVGVVATRAVYGDEGWTISGLIPCLLSIHLIALGVHSLLDAIALVENRFVAAPVARCAGALAWLVVVIGLHARIGVTSVASGALAAELTACALLLSILHHAGARAAPTFARPAPVRRFARLALSEVVGGAITRVNPLVDQLMATAAGIVGGGTLLRYSLDVALVPTSLLQAALFPILLSQFASDAAMGDKERFRTALRKSMLAVSALLAGATALMLGLRRPLLRLAFLRGGMDDAAIEAMVGLLPYHLAGLVPFGLLLVLSRAHVALQNGNIMFSMGALNAILNVVLDAALVRWLGLRGIALATSLVQATIAAVFYVRLDPVMRLRKAVAA